MSQMDRMSGDEIVKACQTVSGYFTRPGDIAYALDQVRAHGITTIMRDSEKGITVVHPGGQFSFTSGLPALDDLIGDMLMRAEMISAAMFIMHAARDDDGAESPYLVEEAIRKMRWSVGDTKEVKS